MSVIGDQRVGVKVDANYLRLCQIRVVPYVSHMWMDDKGVRHTVALPDPAVAMSHDTLASLEALPTTERARIREALEDYYRGEYVTRHDEYKSLALAPEGAPLPHGYVGGPVRTAEDALALVKATEPAWRIDVLEALQDYLEQTQPKKDLEGLPGEVQDSARIESNGEVQWRVGDAAAAVCALADAGHTVLGLDIRAYDPEGRFIEVPWSDHSGTDPAAARDTALEALSRPDLPGEWVLITW